MRIKMVALRPHRVRGQMVPEGGTYEVTRREARTLNAIGYGRAEDEEVQKTLGRSGAKVVRDGTYSRRDMRAEGRQPPDASTGKVVDASEVAQGEDLSKMLRTDLVAIAEREGIEIGARETKADLVKKIAKARKA